MSANEIKNVGLLTSGGDAPGMNACIRAVVRACIYHGLQPYGIREGYRGLINDNIFEMEAGSVRHIIYQGGTILKSARCEAFRSEGGREKAWQNFESHNLDALIVMGGDGTFKGGAAFSDTYNIPLIGIPCTIDNDIFGTDFTIGFDTATNTVVEAVDKIRDTATSHNRLFFIEVMGRDAGAIALNSGVAAGSEEILIPEKDMGIERLFNSLDKSSKRNKSSRLVIVAEGDTNNNVYELKDKVKQRFGDYYETKVTILGHVQRGGRPTCADRILASRLGVNAVESLQKGIQNVMMGFLDNEVQFTDLDRAIKQHAAIDEKLLHVADVVSI